MGTFMNWWKKLFKQQEEIMSTPAETRTIKNLKRQLTNQDDMAVMERDVARFKEQVQSDIKMLAERINK